MPDRDAMLVDVGERLVRLRNARGYDLNQAAAAAGVTPERLADVEAGAVALSEAEITALAQAYGIAATAIFGDSVTRLQDYALG